MSSKSKTKPKYLYDCFKWLYILLFCMGCHCFWLRDDKLIIAGQIVLLSNLIRFLLLTGYVGGLAYKLSDEQSAKAMLDHLPPILKFILTFECITCTLTYILVVILMEWQKRSHKKLIERLRQLDDEMRCEFPQINWHYEKSVRKYTPLTLTVIIYYIIVSMIYLFKIANCNCDLLTTFLIAFSYAFITAAPGGAAFLPIGAMDILRLRYRLISRMVVQFKAAGSKSHMAVYRLSVYCRHYTELILEVNNNFSYVLAVGSFYDFGIMTNLVYLICQKVFESKAEPLEYIFILLFMIPRMYKIITTSLYGNRMIRERRCCIHALSVYAADFYKDTKLQDLFRPFLHWKMLNNYDVTLGKTIICDLNIIFMVLSGIANYVLILIQLQFQQNSITNRLKNHTSWRKSVEMVDVKNLNSH